MMPHLMKNVKITEVQRRTTKLVPNLKSFSYEERLRKLDIPTLTYRRSRGGMMETYKIMKGVYYDNVRGLLFVHQTGVVTLQIYQQRPEMK